MRVEVLGGVEGRRRWPRDDKMRIIEETLAPRAVVTEIAPAGEARQQSQVARGEAAVRRR
jgi:transposase-like protein